MVRLVNAQNATQTLPITTAVNVPFPSHKKKNKQTNKTEQSKTNRSALGHKFEISDVTKGRIIQTTNKQD